MMNIERSLIEMLAVLFLSDMYDEIQKILSTLETTQIWYYAFTRDTENYLQLFAHTLKWGPTSPLPA